MLNSCNATCATGVLERLCRLLMLKPILVDIRSIAAQTCSGLGRLLMARKYNWKHCNLKTSEERQAEDFVIRTLKNKFLILAKQEKYPKTPEITEELDFIVSSVRELERENRENTDQ